jgi:hypothetical protein
MDLSFVMQILSFSPRIFSIFNACKESKLKLRNSQKLILMTLVFVSGRFGAVVEYSPTLQKNASSISAQYKTSLFINTFLCFGQKRAFNIGN